MRGKPPSALSVQAYIWLRSALFLSQQFLGDYHWPKLLCMAWHTIRKQDKKWCGHTLSHTLGNDITGKPQHRRTANTFCKAYMYAERGGLKQWAVPDLAWEGGRNRVLFFSVIHVGVILQNVRTCRAGGRYYSLKSCSNCDAVPVGPEQLLRHGCSFIDEVLCGSSIERELDSWSYG